MFRSLTSSSFSTRSRTSEDELAPCLTTPDASVSKTTAETALLWSVISVMRALESVTSVTLPTRPSGVTTGAFSLMPSPEPAEMVTSCWNGVDGRATMRAATNSKSVGNSGPAT